MFLELFRGIFSFATPMPQIPTQNSKVLAAHVDRVLEAHPTISHLKSWFTLSPSLCGEFLGFAQVACCLLCHLLACFMHISGSGFLDPWKLFFTIKNGQNVVFCANPKQKNST